MQLKRTKMQRRPRKYRGRRESKTQDEIASFEKKDVDSEGH